ncbi:MAG: type II secretion system protein N [Burkholderiaceae bacterium]|nr:type II secretion system protein N [Burkholderiaceae bacterium]MDO9089927.1 type II secretion system protein N [Burkholderiaceae bacterium]
MSIPSQSTWTVRGLSFALWAFAVGSATYWLMGLTTPAAPPPAAPPAYQAAPVDALALARLLGAGAAPAASAQPAASRFALLGVIASRSRRGAALIAIDGKPARPYRVGSRLEEGLILKSVGPRRAVLAGVDGEPSITLDMPPLMK